MRRRLLVFTCVFTSGLIVGWYVPIKTYVWLISAILSLVLLCFFFSKNKRINSTVLYIMIILTGAFWYELAMFPQNLYDYRLGESVQGQGTIVSYPREGEYNTTFIIKVDNITSEDQELSAIERIKLKYQGNIKGLLPGDVISFRGELTKPTVKRNPGGFDYRSYLAASQIFYEVNCYSSEPDILVLGKGLRTWIAKGRKRITSQLKAILPLKESALLQGIIFGDTSQIGDEDWEMYRRSGVVHLFAVSGFHLSVILGLIWSLLSLKDVKPLKRLIMGTMLFLALYYFVGWSVSLIRAMIMAFLSLLAFVLNRKEDLLTNLGIAGLLILIAFPGQILLSGFQLSFAATFGIIYLYPYIERYPINRLISIVIAVQLVTLPLVIYHFHLISIFIPLANVFASILGSIIIILGFIGCSLAWLLPFLAAPFFIFAGFLSLILSEVICFLGSIKWACLVFPSPNVVFFLLYYLFILFLPYNARWLWISRLLTKESKVLGIVVILGCILFFLWPQGDKMKVVFLDVGQGDAMFISTPGGCNLLVDGGGTPFSSYSIGKSVLYPYLLNEGLKDIDMAVLSHFDMDHGEGLLEVMQYVKMGQILIPPAEDNNELLMKIKEKARLENIPVIEIFAGEKIVLDQDVYIDVLHPPKNIVKEGNDRSLVLRLVYKKAEWLLTGDIENEGLTVFMSQNNNFDADILKLPHHGSISSYNESFYSLVKAQAVIVSSGENSYMHPHPNIVQYFDKKEIPVYLTKEKGAVITESDGQSIIVKTMLP